MSQPAADQKPPAPPLRRCLAALATGALTGGVVTVLVFAISAYAIPHDLAALAGFTFPLLRGWLIITLIATLVWAAGLLVLGAPVWLLMHRLSLTSRFQAMLVGALLAGAAGYAIGIAASGLFPVAWFLLFSVTGTLVGFVVRKIAYPVLPKASQNQRRHG